MKARTSTVASLCAALAFLLWPQAADAQVRGSARVRVAVPRGSVIIHARSYPARYFYRPYFYRPYFYGSFLYGSWYRPFGWYGWQYPPYYPYGGFYDQSAALRLQVEPRDTQVFVDGYYAGTVDQFDGVFQRLHAEPGDHDVELYLPGYRTFTQKVYLQPRNTFRIRHEMEPLAPGEPEPVRPDAAARPATRQAPPGRPAPGRLPPQSRELPPPAEPAAGYGTLALRVQPADAVILIDGEEWQGPSGDERLLVQLATGRHVVQIQKDGYRTYTTEITVGAGDTETLNVSLTAQ